MSKIYEFSPSGLRTQNRMMFVIPLLDSHHYDYNNMTLMYRENNIQEFRDANLEKDHKPTWLFHRNSCYIFLNHFCQIYVFEQMKQNILQFCCCITPRESVQIESLLFHKYDGTTLELKLVFGCYDRNCVVFHQNVKNVCVQFYCYK